MEAVQQATDYLYDYGLPFSLILAPNIDALMDRIKKKKASMIIIDGNVGEGKTTLGVHISDYISKYYGSGKYTDFAIQLAMGGKDFSEKLLVCHDQKKVVIVYDESGDFDKKATLTRFNRNLMRIFEMYRGFRILVILCLPKFYKLENELFEIGIPRLLLHVEDRTERQGSFRGFDLEQMYYIKHHASKIIVKPKCYDFGIPNFYGHFLDLPTERSKELDEISVKSKRQEIKKTIYDVKNRVTIMMLQKHFNMSKSWVEKKLKLIDDLGEVKYFDHKKWYDKNVIKQIEDLEEN